MAEYTTISSTPAKKFAEMQGSKIMVGKTTNGTTMFTCGGITGSVAKTLVENGFEGEKLVNEVQRVDEDGVITNFFILTTPFKLQEAHELAL